MAKFRFQRAGSSSKKEFIQFLNIARRATFENANIIILLRRRNLITSRTENKILEKLDKLSRKITSFKKSLR